MIHHGKMIILNKINVYGAGYDVVVSFTWDDFNKLEEIADKEKIRVGNLLSDMCE
jgi:hypothetical protein